MNGVRKAELEAALDLLPIWATKMNDIGERETDRLIWAKESKPTHAHVPDIRGPTRHSRNDAALHIST